MKIYCFDRDLDTGGEDSHVLGPLVRLANRAANGHFRCGSLTLCEPQQGKTRFRGVAELTGSAVGHVGFFELAAQPVTLRELIERRTHWILER